MLSRQIREQGSQLLLGFLVLLVTTLARLGVHEYLLKPVSTKALLERIASVLVKPRQMVQLDDYYGPMPRRLVVSQS